MEARPFSRKSDITTPSMAFGYDGVSASPFQPSLDRLTPDALMDAFKNEIVYCAKLVKGLSASFKESSKLRLALTQLRSTLEKFKPHVPKLIYAQKSVEVGELVMNLRYQQQIASELCFLPVISLYGENQMTSEKADFPTIPKLNIKELEIFVRAKLDHWQACFIELRWSDPYLSEVASVNKAIKIIQETSQFIQANVGEDKEHSGIVLHGLQTLYTFCRVLDDGGWGKEVKPHAKFIVQFADQHAMLWQDSEIIFAILEYRRYLIELLLKNGHGESVESIITASIGFVVHAQSNESLATHQSEFRTNLRWLDLAQFSCLLFRGCEKKLPIKTGVAFQSSVSTAEKALGETSFDPLLTAANIVSGQVLGGLPCALPFDIHSTGQPVTKREFQPVSKKLKSVASLISASIGELDVPQTVAPVETKPQVEHKKKAADLKKVKVVDEPLDVRQKKHAIAELLPILQTLGSRRTLVDGLAFALGLATPLTNTGISFGHSTLPITRHGSILCEIFFYLLMSSKTEELSANAVVDFDVFKIEHQQLQFLDILKNPSQLVRILQILAFHSKWDKCHWLARHHSKLIKSEVESNNDIMRLFASFSGLYFLSEKGSLMTDLTKIKNSELDLTITSKSFMARIIEFLEEDHEEISHLSWNQTRVLELACLAVWKSLEKLIHHRKSNNVLDSHNAWTSIVDDPLLWPAVESVHDALIRNQCNQFKVISTISSIMIQSLEDKGHLKEAIKICQNTLEWIEQCRFYFGEGGDCVNSITTDYTFHPRHVRFVSELKAAHNPANLIQPAEVEVARKTLPCLQVDTLSSLYRCEMKLTYKNKTYEIQAKETQLLELTKKKTHIKQPRFSITKEDILVHCGADPYKKAIYLLSAVSSGLIKDPEEKGSLLKSAAMLLSKAHDKEAAALSAMREKPAKPRLIRRTADSCTVAVNVEAFSSTPKRNLAWIQAFCAPAKTHLSLSSSHYAGTGVFRRIAGANEVEFTVFGLDPLLEYQFGVAAFSESEEKGHLQPIRSDASVCSPGFPLPILLCWGYLSMLASQCNHGELSESANAVLMSHFVSHKADESILRELSTNSTLSEESFEMNSNALFKSSSAIKRLFIQNILQSIQAISRETHAAVITEEPLAVQLQMLHAICDLLIATKTAKDIGDYKLMVFCVLKAYNLLVPFTRSFAPVAFVTKALLSFHEVLITSFANFGLGHVRTIRDFYAPLIYTLLSRLILVDNYALAAKVANEAYAFMTNLNLGAEIKVLNSLTVENLTLGYIFKPKKIRGNHTKSHYYAEFAYHSKAAIEGPVDKGLYMPQRPLSVLMESIEVLMAKESHFVTKLASSHPDLAQTGRSVTMTDSNASISKRPLLLQRKSLDTQTSLKEIYILFASCGPEATLQELVRFKKSPRYVEIVTRLVEWCMEKDIYETAIRIAADLEDWVDKRTQTIYLADVLGEEAITQKEVVIRRRKRPMFATDKMTLIENILKSAKERAAQKSKHSKNKDKKPEKSRDKIEATDPTKPVERQRNVKSADSKTTSKRSKTPPTSAGKSSSKDNSKDSKDDNDSLPASLAGSRPASRSGSGGKKAVVDEISRPTSAISPKDEISKEDAEQATYIAMKRKRIQQRHAYFAGMSASEKERKDHAAKILDNHLSSLWHRRRYARRVRHVLDIECAWRSHLLLLKSNGIFHQMKKDHHLIGPNLANVHEFFDTEWLHFAASGKQFLPLHQTLKAESNGAVIIDSEWSSPANTVGTTEVLQSIVQSIVLAARYGLWAQVFKSSRSLWAILRFLIRTKRLANDFWKYGLCKGLYVAADSILDALKHVHLTYKSSNLPLDYASLSVSEIFDTLYAATWFSKGERKFTLVNLGIHFDLILMAMDSLQSAEKWNRLNEWLPRLSFVLKGSLDSYLKPVHEAAMKYSGNPSQGLYVGSDTVLLDQTLECRKQYCQYLMDSLKNSNNPQRLDNALLTVLQSHENALQIAHAANDLDMFALLCFQQGDLLCESGNVVGASVFWSKCLDAIFQQHKFVGSWKTILGFHEPHSVQSLSRHISSRFKVRETTIASLAATRLARFFYFNNSDKQADLLYCASLLLTSSLMSVIANPLDSMDYWNYALPNLLPITSMITDKFLVNSLSLCDSILYMVRIQSKFANSVSIPLLALADHLASHHLQSVYVTSEIAFMQLSTLADNGQVQFAIKKLAQVSRRSFTEKREEEGSAELLFDNMEYPISIINLQSIRQLFQFNFNEKIRNATMSLSQDADLARCSLVLKIFNFAHLNGVTLAGQNFNNLIDIVKGLKQDPKRSLPNLSGFDAWFVSKAKTPGKAPSLFAELELVKNEIFELTRTSLAKVISQMQFVIKSHINALNKPLDEKTPKMTNVFTYDSFIKICRRFISAFTLVAVSFQAQGKYRSAAKWHRSIRVFISTLGSSDATKPGLTKLVIGQLGPEFVLENRLYTIDCIYSEGLYPAALKLANDGLLEAAEFKSGYYTLLFWTRILEISLRASKQASSGNSLTSEQLQNCHEALGKHEKDLFLSEVRGYLACLLDLFKSESETHKKRGPVLTNDSMYQPNSIRAMVCQFHQAIKDLEAAKESETNIYSTMKQFFGSPLRIPIQCSVKFAIHTSLLLTNKVEKMGSHDLQKEVSGLKAKSKLLCEYALQELMDQGGYDHALVIHCVKQILRINLSIPGQTVFNSLCINFIARSSRMQNAIQNKLVPSTKINADDLPLVLVQEIIGFKSGLQADPLKDWYPETFELMYVDESSLLDRQRVYKSMAIYLPDLLEYRAHLDEQLLTGSTYLYDERDIALYNKRHRLHLLMLEKYSWYGELCIKQSDLSENTDKLKLKALNASSGYCWIPSTTGNKLCVYSAEKPQKEKVPEETTASRRTSTMPETTSKPNSPNKVNVLFASAIFENDTIKLGQTLASAVISNLSHVDLTKDMSYKVMAEEAWTHLLALLGKNAEKKPLASLRGALFLLQLFDVQSSDGWNLSQCPPSKVLANPFTGAITEDNNAKKISKATVQDEEEDKKLLEWIVSSMNQTQE